MTMANDYMTKNIDCELVIGIVCAVGTKKKPVIGHLKERFERAGYDVEIVKVTSDVIPLLQKTEDFGADECKRINFMMDAGNKAREAATSKAKNVFKDQNRAERHGNAVLALGASIQMLKRRIERSSKENPEPLLKTVFIIDSLKRPEEVDQLRLTYPDGFVLLGIHEELDDRRVRLTKDFLEVEHDEEVVAEQVDDLIKRDREETSDPHGQRLNDTFHLADFFVKASDHDGQREGDIERIVDLLFGNPFITPTFDEHAMFLAFATSLRSADLSRQVGAVIAREKHILSTGANECPQYGGGLYWPDRTAARSTIHDQDDGRDYMRGEDSNRAELLSIMREILDEAKEKGMSAKTRKILQAILEKSRVRDLTEFGRVVHAEMEAILACGRSGQSTVGATLYCTTFPCHNCAKHIVASGLDRVVYVEPYPKSKALDLHDDSIANEDKVSVNLDKTGKNCVRFVPFVGVGPRRFFDLFSMHLSSGYDLIRKEKKTGQKRDWYITNARLRLQMKPLSYLELEGSASKLFDQVADTLSGKDDES